MQKYGCGVDELTLRGRCDRGKGRAHLVMMNLPEEDDWKHYKETVRKWWLIFLVGLITVALRTALVRVTAAALI
jgi:hypothetical protein